jgi:peptidoglycan hydrolase CwlO-like protein
MLVNKTEDKRKMTVGALNKKVDESLTDLKKQLLDLSQKIEMLVNNVEKLQEDVDELKTYKPSKRNRFWLF